MEPPSRAGAGARRAPAPARRAPMTAIALAKPCRRADVEAAAAGSADDPSSRRLAR
jgi:hypothetical protein